jgi:glycosyltransferase involved in cell wall biosynthesis
MIQDHQMKDKLPKSPHSVLGKPVFSIITPTFNCKSKINGTLESVLLQDFKNFEYLFLDGNSRDGIQELLAQIKDPRVRSWSEPDNGIYDAMNKGIRHARGRYLIFLGAGDKLFPGVLQHISQHLPKTDTGFIYGNVLWGETIFDGPSSKLKLCSRNICHQAIFYGRDVFKALGNYDLKYPILADWAFNIKCFGERRIIIRHIPINVTDYELGGISRIGDPVFEADKMRMIRLELGMITFLRHQINPWPGTFFLKSKQMLKQIIPPIILTAVRKILHFFHVTHVES